jgi:hypothetical protein
MKVIPSDVGRPLSDIKLRVPLPDVAAAASRRGHRRRGCRWHVTGSYIVVGIAPRTGGLLESIRPAFTDSRSLMETRPT